jgi:hypothetical protein
MAKAKQSAQASETKSPKAKASVVTQIPSEDTSLKQVFKVLETTSEEDILRYAEMPGVTLEFDYVRFRRLDDSFVGMLPASAQKAYWIAHEEFESRKRLADRAVYETPNVVDPMSKLLDGPHGMSNPLTHDQDEVRKRMGSSWYVTWRVEGGQGDIDAALRAGFRVVRRPKDDAERENVDPTEWSGERWKIRDGTIDPISGDEIFNVMVYIRAGAWKDNLQAMSMISHNAYSTNKKQFVEGVDNISRDMLSSKERVQTVDLDEMHVEEHTVVQNGKRVQVDPQRVG